MRDNEHTRKHYAEVAANWIKEVGNTATVLELKKHAQNPSVGYTPYWTWAIRDSKGELADIDVRRFCDLLGAKHPYPDSGSDLHEVLKDAGFVCYRTQGVIVILDKNNPLLANRKGETK